MDTNIAEVFEASKKTHHAYDYGRSASNARPIPRYGGQANLSTLVLHNNIRCLAHQFRLYRCRKLST